MFNAPLLAAWAKLDPDRHAALPLVDHGADVAAVMDRLLTTGAWAARLAHAAGRALDAQDRDRLCALAYLHDLGKANSGFWRRWAPGAPIVGHTNETAALFRAAETDRPATVLREMIADWNCEELFYAVMSHHGRPLGVYHVANLDAPMPPDVEERIRRDRPAPESKSSRSDPDRIRKALQS